MGFIAAPRYDTPSYLWPRPRYRGVLHAVGALVVVPLGLWLLISVQGNRARWAAGVYLIAQLCVFATSALYHRVARNPEVRRRMQLADHSMIYVLIAGTWAPLCLLALPRAWGVPALAAVILAAAAGIVLKLCGVNRFPRASNTIYGVMGGAGLFVMPELVDNLSLAAFALLALGGAVYTAGAVVLMRKYPDPRPRSFGYHEIFHACTVAAFACHFTMVWIVSANQVV